MLRRRLRAPTHAEASRATDTGVIRYKALSIYLAVIPIPCAVAGNFEREFPFGALGLSLVKGKSMIDGDDDPIRLRQKAAAMSGFYKL